MKREPKIDFVDTPENIRSNYQYFTEADLTRIRQAGYTKPFTSLEDGAASYIRDYLATNDPHR
jgi:ADP-L-glycero-D-manno-heptose 6-epimerase